MLYWFHDYHKLDDLKQQIYSLVLLEARNSKLYLWVEITMLIGVYFLQRL